MCTCLKPEFLLLQVAQALFAYSLFLPSFHFRIYFLCISQVFSIPLFPKLSSCLPAPAAICWFFTSTCASSQCLPHCISPLGGISSYWQDSFPFHLQPRSCEGPPAELKAWLGAPRSWMQQWHVVPVENRLVCRETSVDLSMGVCYSWHLAADHNERHRQIAWGKLMQLSNRKWFC